MVSGVGDSSRVERLGRYELLAQLATGGMAEVFLARARGIGGFERLVVVKRILPALTANTNAVAMFLDEARIAAALRHPNIVQVFDVGVERGEFYLAMEYLHGADVARLVQTAHAAGTGVPLGPAVAIVLGVLTGLEYAHTRVDQHGRSLGIVHRDVSPPNVLVTYAGEVKLVDFGIAKAAYRVATTRAGSLKGKIRYMSPEQVRLEPVDARSDLFSSAVLLWELTTGRRLFDQPAELDVLAAIVDTDAPRPSSVCPSYPAALEAIVMRGLARDRAARFQTAAEMYAALDRFAVEQSLRVSSLELARFVTQLLGPEDAAGEAPVGAAWGEPAVVAAGSGDGPTLALSPPDRQAIRPRGAFARRAVILTAVAALLALLALAGIVLLSRRPVRPTGRPGGGARRPWAPVTALARSPAMVGAAGPCVVKMVATPGASRRRPT
jgi:serine/threonine-protein kinase